MVSADPLSLRYMKIIRFFLQSVGAWPKESNVSWSAWYLRYLIFQTTFFVFGEYLFIMRKFHFLSFFDLGDKLLIFTIGVLEVYRVTLPISKRYGIIIQNFITKFHLNHFTHLGEYNKKINYQINRLSDFFTVVMSILVLMAMTLFFLAPMYMNHRHGVSSGRIPENYTAQFAVTYEFPFYDPQNHYRLASYMNIWLSYVCTIAICANDILLSLLVFQIIGHIKTLQHDLHQMKKPKSKVSTIYCPINKSVMNLNVEMFDDQENEQIHQRIVQCVEHHKLIVSFTEDISNLFGPVLGLNYLFHLFACCLVLLECSQGEPGALARYGPLSVVIFFQLIQISITFEIVGSESEKLKDYVYDVPWECMSVRNQRSICIFLHRAQTPITITAMGMTSVGVQTMASILKTTFSYYAFLQSMSE